MENMKDIKVNSTLLSDKISVSNIDESIIATIKETAGEGNIAEYFAFVIGLDVYVDEVLVQVDQLTKLQEPITLTIEIPEGLPEVSKGMTRIYSMIRVHNGVAEKLPVTNNGDGTISFETDRFSIYALAYLEKGSILTKEDVDYICGDINNDGKVNSFDRNILARYIANWDGYDINNYNAAAADVNLDGKVNSFDRNILARHIAAWDGYETLPYK